ncbi:MAG TPA: DUF4266 domain-containing protein [Steroidobacteraceae bacterium]
MAKYAKRERSTNTLPTAYSLQPAACAQLRGALALAALLALSACGNIEPWVKPYEREALADPIMSFDAHPISTAYTHHVFEAREGARGALGSAGGGCGCN